MSELPVHWVHLLVRRELPNGGFGWVAPLEMEDDSASSDAGLVIPVRPNGEPFEGGYSLEVAVLENGTWERLREPFTLRHDGADRFLLETNSADIPFVAATVPPEQQHLSYTGDLYHPDFASPMLEIEAVEGVVFDLLLDRNKVFLVGCYPFEHYQRQDGSPLVR